METGKSKIAAIITRALAKMFSTTVSAPKQGLMLSLVYLTCKMEDCKEG